MNARMVAAVAAIIVIVAVVYVFSIVPYVFPGGKSIAPTSPTLEILIPVAAAPLILVLVFLIPARRTVEAEDETGNPIEVIREPADSNPAERRYRKRSIVAGSIAGFAAACFLAAVMFLGDYLMGLPFGAFYEIIALAMTGVSQPITAISLGVVMHLISGTAIGSVFGFLTATIGPFNLEGIRKGIVVGMLAGFVSFSVLFVPITRFEVEPALTGVLINYGIIAPSASPSETQSQVTDFMSSVLAYSILFHVLYGAILGGLTVFLMGKLPLRNSHQFSESTGVRKTPDHTEAA